MLSRFLIRGLPLELDDLRSCTPSVAPRRGPCGSGPAMLPFGGELASRKRFCTLPRLLFQHRAPSFEESNMSAKSWIAFGFRIHGVGGSAGAERCPITGRCRTHS